MFRYMVIGANGMLGSYLFKKMKACNDLQVIGTSRSKSQTPDLFGKIDITNNAVMVKLISKFLPDIIFICAGLTNVDLCEKEKDLAWKVNVEAIDSLMRNIKSTGIGIVYYSTDYVFDGKKEEGYAEGDIPNPVNYYGYTKLEGEERVLSYKRGWVVRLSMFGWRPDLYKAGLIENLLHTLSENKKLALSNSRIFNPLYVGDVFDISIGLLAKKPGLYHAGCMERVTTLELCQKIARAFGMDPNLITLEEKQSIVKRPKISYLKVTRDKRSGFLSTSLEKSIDKLRKEKPEWISL